MNTPGYAVRKDTSLWRVVDGAEPDPSNPEKVYMDPEEEFFMSFEDGPPPSPLPTTAELAGRALAERDRLLAVAAIRIAPLQDAVDLDDADDAIIALLRSWKKYRVELNDIPKAAEFPRNISWPEAPDPTEK